MKKKDLDKISKALDKIGCKLEFTIPIKINHKNFTIKKEEKTQILDTEKLYKNIIIHSPIFMPNDGLCYTCGYDLFKHYNIIAPNSAITGCPNCYKSFCE